MNTTVKNFERPEGQVHFSAVNIDTAKCTFSLNYAFVAKGKRKIIFVPVKGTITPELKEWLTKVFPEKVNVVIDGNTVSRETGVNTTGFQIFLKRIEKQFVPGILSTLTFTGDNNSEDYYTNPFKLIILNDKSVLSLVNIAPKEKKMQFNPESGKTEIHYKQRYFKVGNDFRRSYVPKKNYCRLIIQQDKIVEIATPETAAAS